jgi:hypothetical protein
MNVYVPYVCTVCIHSVLLCMNVYIVYIYVRTYVCMYVCIYCKKTITVMYVCIFRDINFSVCMYVCV